MAERRSREYLTQEQAEQLWRRAAELQAEAESAEPRVERALPAEEVIQLSDVEAAAVEAGITPKFLHLARAEAQAWDGRRLSPRADRAATLVLGSETPTLRATRWFPEPPSRIVELIGHVYPAAPFHLSLKDISGEDLANGGVLIFDTPSLMTHQTRFTLAMAYADLSQVLVSVAPARRGEVDGAEVVVVGSLERARKLNLGVAGTISGFLGLAGGVGGAAIGIGAAGLPVLIGLLPAALGATLAGGAFAGIYRFGYRFGLRKGLAGLEEMLQAVHVQLRTRGLIAAPEASPPRP